MKLQTSKLLQIAVGIAILANTVAPAFAVVAPPALQISPNNPRLKHNNIPPVVSPSVVPSTQGQPALQISPNNPRLEKLKKYHASK
jgi:hypothetical protein